MYTYLCKLLYIGDRSSHSSNIPDQIGHQCLIKSDSSDLESIPEYRIKNNYLIQELLEHHDCESISVELLNEEDISEYSDLKDVITINKKDLD